METVEQTDFDDTFCKFIGFFGIYLMVGVHSEFLDDLI